MDRRGGQKLMKSLIIGIAVLFLSNTSSGQICDTADFTGTNELNAPLSDLFSVDIELSKLDEIKTNAFKFYYDKSKNAIATKVADTLNERIYSLRNYTTAQQIYINLDPKITSFDQKCQIRNIDGSNADIIFDDIQTIPAKPGTTIPTPAILFLQDRIWKKQPASPVVRGISTDYYKSCYKVSGVPLLLEAYYSKGWSMPYNNIMVVPLRVTVTKDINTTSNYEFLHFRNYSHSDHFQIPPGSYCVGLDSPGKIKVQPNYFAFKAEIVDYNGFQVDYMNGWFDHTLKFARYDYKPAESTFPIREGLYGGNPLREIHDFNAGISYTTDILRGNCSITPIVPGFRDTVDIGTDLNLLVNMSSVNQFFGFNKNMKIKYMGQSTIRGITCDAFTAPIKTDFKKMTVTWYLATNDWSVDPGTRDYKDIQVNDIIAVDVKNDFGFIESKRYNIYRFDAEEKDFDVFEIGNCFSTVNKRRYTITFKDTTYNTVVKDSIDMFKQIAVAQLTAATGLKTSRISRMKVDFLNEGVALVFTVLGIPDVKGDVNNPDAVPDVNLATADKLLKQTVNSAAGFVVYVSGIPVKATSINDDIKYETVTRKTKVVEKKTVTEGMSSGGVIGIGVGLFALGLLLGILAIIGLTKMRGGEGGRGSAFSRFA